MLPNCSSRPELRRSSGRPSLLGTLRLLELRADQVDTAPYRREKLMLDNPLKNELSIKTATGVS